MKYTNINIVWYKQGTLDSDRDRLILFANDSDGFNRCSICPAEIDSKYFFCYSPMGGNFCWSCWDRRKEYLSEDLYTKKTELVESMYRGR